jgi:hypothetical protein
MLDNDEVMSEEEAETIMSQPEDEMLESLSEEAEEAFDAELVNNARLRLEQGRLYEMLLKHDFFEGMDADQRAVSNVQKEVRNFVRERLEVLVGLRQDPRLAPKAAVQVNLPFNSLEIELLKKMLAKASNGATLVSNEPVPAPKQAKLNPVKVTPVAPPKKVVQSKVTVNNTKPTPKAAVKPAQPESSEPPPLQKDPKLMSPEELLQVAKERGIYRQYRKAVNPNKMPMPDADQQVMHMTQRVSEQISNPLMQGILSRVTGGKGTMMETISNDDTTSDDRI